MSDSSDDIDRRAFLSRSARMAGGAMTALSYSRILGANDRIALGHIGIGNRGRELHGWSRRLQGHAQRRDRRRVRPVDAEPRAGRERRPRGTTGVRRGRFSTSTTCWR